MLRSVIEISLFIAFIGILIGYLLQKEGFIPGSITQTSSNAWNFIPASGYTGNVVLNYNLSDGSTLVPNTTSFQITPVPTCSIGSYLSGYNCVTCPAGQTTASTGATSSSACFNPSVTFTFNSGNVATNTVSSTLANNALPLTLTSGSWAQVGLSVNSNGNITTIGPYTTYTISGSIQINAGCDSTCNCPTNRFINLALLTNQSSYVNLLNACRNYTCSQQTVNPANNYNVANLAGSSLNIVSTQIQPGSNWLMAWYCNWPSGCVAGSPNTGTITLKVVQ